MRVSSAERREWRRLRACALALGLATACASFAQAPPPGAEQGLGFERPSERRLPSPSFESPEPVLPPALPPAAVPRSAAPAAPTGPAVRLREVKLVGNTVFSADELASTVAPYLARPISNEDLEQLRLALTRYYVDRGYINSGAVIPDQQVVDGVLVIQIVEGRLTEIRIDGEQGLREAYLRERIALGAGPPLDINALQSALQIQAQSPLLRRLNANLQPGDRAGEARLSVSVQEARPYDIVFVVDNDISPDLGPVQGRAVGRVFNLTGYGDVLSGDVAFGRGLRDFAIDYTRPINAYDTALSVYGQRVDSEIVERPLHFLGIESESSTVGFRITHPLYRTPTEQLSFGFGLERRRSQTFLCPRGAPTCDPGQAFSEGVEPDGESKVSVIRVTQDWVSRSRSQVFAARSTFSLGVGIFGATINDGAAPDGSFVSWLGQVQWARRFGENDNQIIVRADGQLTDDPLLPLEQFSVGGANSVRGYRTNLLVRDWGYSASAELRIPIWRDDAGRTVLQLAPFVDVGGGWNRERPTPVPRTISSVGAGLRWDPSPRLHAELYWGLALRDVDVANEGLQDSGVHFSLTAALFD